MKITYAPNGILLIDDARITFKNFGGRGDRFNREGDRNFALIIDNQEDAERLSAAGWNVKIKPPREEGDSPFMYMKVNVSYKFRGPEINLQAGPGGRVVQLDEETVGRLDNLDIMTIDMDIRPRSWERPDGSSGITAYLEAMHVIQQTSRFAARFANEEE